jgi:hypothetical protein
MATYTELAEARDAAFTDGVMFAAYHLICKRDEGSLAADVVVNAKVSADAIRQGIKDWALSPKEAKKMREELADYLGKGGRDGK